MAKHGQPAAFLAFAISYESDACLRWPYSRDSKGSGQLLIEGRMQRVCRVVCTARHGPPPTPRHHAAHSCGNGHLGCCNGRHLRWATPKQNAADKLIHGTVARGERCGSAKLLEDEAREILALQGQMPRREIADLFGINERTVADIHDRKTWAWLD